MSPPTPFRTVYDVKLYPDEYRIWGGLPQTEADYPRLDSLSAQDSALAHMFLVLRGRRDFAGARRHALQISDTKYRDAYLSLLPQTDA